MIITDCKEQIIEKLDFIQLNGNLVDIKNPCYFTDFKSDGIKIIKDELNLKSKFVSTSAHENIRVSTFNCGDNRILIKSYAILNPSFRKIYKIEFQSDEKVAEIYPNRDDFIRIQNGKMIYDDMIAVGAKVAWLNYHQFNDGSFNFDYKLKSDKYELNFDGFDLYVRLPWSRSSYSDQVKFDLKEVRLDMDHILNLLKGIETGVTHEFEVKVRKERSYYTKLMVLDYSYDELKVKYKDDLYSMNGELEVYMDGKLIETYVGGIV